MIVATYPTYALTDAEAADLWVSVEGPEQFLQTMRARGAKQVESIRALHHYAGMSLEDAKELVHFSQAWSDHREAAEALHRNLHKAAVQDAWVDVDATHFTAA